MAANLQFFEEKQHSPIKGALDFGLSRDGVASVQAVRIKNAGDLTALDCVLKADTLNQPGEVSVDELRNQVYSASKKSFSFFPNKNFVPQLNIGEIFPGLFATGYVEKPAIYGVNMSSVFTSGLLTPLEEQIKLSHIGGETKSGTAARLTSPDLVGVKELSLSFSVEVAYFGSGVTNAYIIVPVRIDSKGDDKGYLFMLRFEKGRMQSSIWKDGKGIETHYDRDYGRMIFESTELPLVKPEDIITLKSYNKGRIPTFQILINNKPIKLGRPETSSVTHKEEVGDNEDSIYLNEGKVFIDMTIDTAEDYMKVSNIVVERDSKTAPIYIRTLMDDKGVNDTTYKSSMVVNYRDDRR